MDRWQDFRTVDLGDWNTIERRIGERVRANGIVLRWVLDDVIDLRDDHLGRLVEVSVTGGAIEATADVPVPVGGRAHLGHGSTDSEVAVRHARPTATAGMVRYGVEWIRLEEPLRTMVYDAVARARPPGTDG